MAENDPQPGFLPAISGLLGPAPGGNGCPQLQSETPVHGEALPAHPACPCSPAAPHPGISFLSAQSRGEVCETLSTHSCGRPLLPVSRLVIHTTYLQPPGCKTSHHMPFSPEGSLLLPPPCALAVTWQGRRTGRGGLGGSPLPGHRPHQAGLDSSRGSGPGRLGYDWCAPLPFSPSTVGLVWKGVLLDLMG